MAQGSKGRRLIDAVDDLVGELRTANALAALTLGAAALDHDTKGEQSPTVSTAERAVTRNTLRKAARVGLGIEEASRGN
ncbi:MAG: hypothetical protein J0I43_01805 [Microbacterium sp.]|uniref:hypothetical protein n=1 Tax=Microbacterium sp. TaxID=51671 RepID=UPI001AD55B06|nr:hypothetical protein [Microbacterium sp.]MBN9176093.1 hypothetical protein [Microbacterium sp.]